jgi:hypothetical protein
MAAPAHELGEGPEMAARLPSPAPFRIPAFNRTARALVEAGILLAKRAARD